VTADEYDTTPEPDPNLLHWREREARGIPDAPPIWSEDKWAEVVREIRAKRNA
jgi:hypothetical protein